MAKKTVVLLLRVLGLAAFFCGVVLMIAHFDSAKLAGVVMVSVLVCSFILLGIAEAIAHLGHKNDR